MAGGKHQGVPATPSDHSAKKPEPQEGLGHAASVPNAGETYGVAGYTTKGLKAPAQIIFHHPNGGSLMFESICQNGVDGVIMDWQGDGVICVPFDRFEAMAQVLAPEGFLRRVRAAQAIEAGTATDSEAGVAEGESAVGATDAPQAR